MMKKLQESKFLSILLSLIIVLSMFAGMGATQAYATDYTTGSIDPSTLSVGDTVTANVRLDPDKQIVYCDECKKIWILSYGFTNLFPEGQEKAYKILDNPEHITCFENSKFGYNLFSYWADNNNSKDVAYTIVENENNVQKVPITSLLDFTQASTLATGDGYSWDADTATLTLTDFSMKLVSGGNGYKAINLPENAKIVLNGNNSIEVTQSDSYVMNGINADDGLTIEGTGSLTVRGQGVSVGIMAEDGNITISGGNINVTDSEIGIYSNKDVIINGGTVTATNNKLSESPCGILGAENVKINGGVVNATSNMNNGAAIACVAPLGGGIYVSGGTVTAYGTPAFLGAGKENVPPPLEITGSPTIKAGNDAGSAAVCTIDTCKTAKYVNITYGAGEPGGVEDTTIDSVGVTIDYSKIPSIVVGSTVPAFESYKEGEYTGALVIDNENVYVRMQGWWMKDEDNDWVGAPDTKFANNVTYGYAFMLSPKDGYAFNENNSILHESAGKNDRIELLYDVTNDDISFCFTLGTISDIESEKGNKPNDNPTRPSRPAVKDPVTNTGSAGTDNATTSADIKDKVTATDGKVEAVVDQTVGDKIVDKAVSNKSTEVVIEATTTAGKSDASTVVLPEKTVKAIAEKTEAAITIKTDNATVNLDKDAVAAVAQQAGDTGIVELIVETVDNTAEQLTLELKLKTTNGYVSDFKGGNVSVTVTIASNMSSKKLVCVYIDDNGIYHRVDGALNDDGTYTFNTGHFSTYAIMAEEEADAAITAQKEAVKDIKIKLTSKLAKTKTGKKGITLIWTTDAGDNTLDGVEVFRSTERYKGYGTKPFYSTKNGKTEGYYINTKSLKKGTRYYYRVRGYVLVDGQKIYTDYSNKAWRTVK